ncbi:MAG: hypothetical protein K9M84_03545 [Spirochaetia bacterium]|nr:hypothetical protein [Spirochaetia bacterium]
MNHTIHLLQRQFYEDRKGLMIYAGVIFGVLLLPAMIAGYTNNLPNTLSDTAYAEDFGSFLLLGGFIITSLLFSENMHSKVKQHSWLMLPVHTHEKLISPIIWSGILYPIALMLYFSIVTFIIEGLSVLLFGRSAQMFNMFDLANWEMVLNYFILQSVFLLGAAYFKSAHFIKTVLALIVGTIILSLISLLVFRIVYAPYFHEMMRGPGYFTGQYLTINTLQSPLFTAVEVGAKILYWFVLAPFCWVVTYFRIREVQATDAV